MSIHENFTNTTYKFYPAYLSTGKEWKIIYYVFNPYTNEMQRFRIKLNHIKTVSERRKIARSMIIEINQKLYQGWKSLFKRREQNCIHSLARNHRNIQGLEIQGIRA